MHIYLFKSLKGEKCEKLKHKIQLHCVGKYHHPVCEYLENKDFSPVDFLRQINKCCTFLQEELFQLSAQTQFVRWAEDNVAGTQSVFMKRFGDIFCPYKFCNMDKISDLLVKK